MTAERRESRKRSGPRKKQNAQDHRERTSAESTDSEDTFIHISDRA